MNAPHPVLETPSENCLPVGSRLAEFEVTGVIGEGGFGIVYLAFDHSLQRTVAIKEYMPAQLAARGADATVAIRSPRHAQAFEAGRRSFINEARLLAQFDHPALVKVYRFWEERGTAYMAMRYYDGETFKHVVRTRPGSIDEAVLLRLLTPLLQVLTTLSEAQILHRDISPENILIGGDGMPVLLDFGAARQIVTGLTRSLTVILKPGYAPVEQYADDNSMNQGPWTDLYSLAAVMYFAITRKAPPAAVGRMLKDPLRPLARKERPGYSHRFLSAIDRALAVRPEDRPQSIEAFAELLGIDLATPRPEAGRATTAGPYPLASTEPAPAPARRTDARGARKEEAHFTHVKPRRAGSAGVRVGGSIPAPRPPEPVIVEVPHARWWPLPALGAALITAFVGWHYLNADPAPAAPAAAATAPSPAPRPAAAASAGSGPASGVAAASAPPPAAASAHVAPASVPAAESVSGGEQVISWDALNKQLAKPGAAAAASARAGAAPAKPAARPTGAVMLAIRPWGRVMVDGAMRGVSPPLKKLTLPQGSHRISVVNPHFPPYTARISVSPGKETTVALDFSAAPAH